MQYIIILYQYNKHKQSIDINYFILLKHLNELVAPFKYL